MAAKTSFRSWDAANRRASQMYRTGKYQDVQVKKVLDSSRQGHHWSIKTSSKNPTALLPKQWTAAKVRVNPQGKVQVKIAANKARRRK